MAVETAGGRGGSRRSRHGSGYCLVKQVSLGAMATGKPLSPAEETLWRAVMRIVKVMPRHLDSDNDPPRERRGRPTNQAFRRRIFRCVFGRRRKQPPDDGWSGASFGRRQVLESRRARGWKAANDSAVVEVEDFGQEGGAHGLLDYFALDERVYQLLQRRFESSPVAR